MDTSEFSGRNYPWSSSEAEIIRSLYSLVEGNKDKIPSDELTSWKECHEFITKKETELSSLSAEQAQLDQEREKKQLILQVKERKLKEKLQKTQNELERVNKLRSSFSTDDKLYKSCSNHLIQIKNIVQPLKEQEEKQMEDFEEIFRRKKLSEFVQADIPLLLARMGLSSYVNCFKKQGIDGELLSFAEETLLVGLGMTGRDACCFLYHREMMLCPLYSHYSSGDCTVCFHNTPKKTVELLEEYEITLLDRSTILRNRWLVPHLLYLTRFEAEFGLSSVESLKIRKTLHSLKQEHVQHLKTMC